MRQIFHSVAVATRRAGLYEFTEQAADFVRGAKIADGLLTCFIRHTSASLLIQENADPDVRADLEGFFRRLVTDGDPAFIHSAEGPDDMPAHIRTALTTVNLSVPIAGGELTLGTWQGIYLWEHRRAGGPRSVLVHLGS